MIGKDVMDLMHKHFELEEVAVPNKEDCAKANYGGPTVPIYMTKQALTTEGKLMIIVQGAGEVT